jgi:hypothetical protein
MRTFSTPAPEPMKPLPIRHHAAALCLAAMLTLAQYAAIHALALPGTAPTAQPTAYAVGDRAANPPARQC